MDFVRIGLAVRALRRRRGWTQSELASRAGCSRSEVSRIERGQARDVDRIERVLAVFGARLSIKVLWQGEELDRLLDRDHAMLVEAMVALLTAEGWVPVPEATFSIRGERGSIDILAWHPIARVLLVIEVKSVVPDVQATLAGVARRSGTWLGRSRRRTTPGPAGRPHGPAAPRSVRRHLQPSVSCSLTRGPALAEGAGRAVVRGAVSDRFPARGSSSPSSADGVIGHVGARPAALTGAQQARICQQLPE